MRYWPAIATATLAIATAIPVLFELAPHLIPTQISKRNSVSTNAEPEPVTEPLGMVDLDRIQLSEQRATAPVGTNRTAHLTIIPRLQKSAERILGSQQVASGAIIAINPKSGEILTYASRSWNPSKNGLPSLPA
ncbi:MAG: hypothetical protein FWD57_14850, partial [Polyangiaceae bacterium]|nr:hypothetical protein [Polyangiaceae bacterium]